MLVTDIIKIKYSQEGYLPNYPPHLVSNEEMCEAFLTADISYFYDNYILVNEDLENEYNTLLNAIKYHFARFLTKAETAYCDLPDWVYSYMLSEVVNQNSDAKDRHYLLTSLGVDNIEDEITPISQRECYKVSTRWVRKLDKSSKIINLDDILKDLSDSDKEILQADFEKWGVKFDTLNNILMRPPTMFGEPHVIKILRIGQV